LQSNIAIQIEFSELFMEFYQELKVYNIQKAMLNYQV